MFTTDLNLFDDCLNSPGAEFYRDVMVRGARFARLRALRPLDRDLIIPSGATRVVNGRVEFTDRMPGVNEITLRTLCCRLGGVVDGRSTHVGDEGWALPTEITVETLNALPEDVLIALMRESNDMELTNGRAEAYSGNSETDSGSPS